MHFHRQMGCKLTAHGNIIYTLLRKRTRRKNLFLFWLFETGFLYVAGIKGVCHHHLATIAFLALSMASNISNYLDKEVTMR